VFFQVVFARFLHFFHKKSHLMVFFPEAKDIPVCLPPKMRQSRLLFPPAGIILDSGKKLHLCKGNITYG
jgi:hypothetical protein